MNISITPRTEREVKLKSLRDPYQSKHSYWRLLYTLLQKGDAVQWVESAIEGHPPGIVRVYVKPAIYTFSIRLKESLQILFQTRNPIAAWRTMLYPINIVTSPHLAREALLDRDGNFGRGGGESHVFMREIFGSSIINVSNEDRETWDEYHRSLASFFGHSHEWVPELIQLMRDQTAGWRDNETIDVIRETKLFTHRVIFHITLPEFAHDSMGNIFDDFATVGKGFFWRSALPLNIPKKWILWGKYARAIERIDKTIYGLIQQQRKSMKDQQANGTPRDILSVLIGWEKQNGQRFTDKEIRDQIVAVLFAGHETTALTLAWLWHLVAKAEETDPGGSNVRMKFYREIESLPLLKGAPARSDLINLRYMGYVLSETKRVRTVGLGILRNILRDTCLGQFRLKKNEALFIWTYGLHMDKAVWGDNAHQFVPERFEHLTRAQGLSYIPFGAGQHACLGAAFVDTEMRAAMYAIVKEGIQLDNVMKEVKPTAQMTLQVKGGKLLMKITRA